MNDEEICTCELFVNENDEIEFAVQCDKHKDKPRIVKWR
jgi:hypothetical protein